LSPLKDSQREIIALEAFREEISSKDVRQILLKYVETRENDGWQKTHLVSSNFNCSIDSRPRFFEFWRKTSSAKILSNQKFTKIMQETEKIRHRPL
jgi:hypothetical protein